MAGINRLGKAPPRPGSLRPPDPNRNKTLDVFSEGTEGDADYMRMVQDIEDTQGGQSGWLFGRGAFDKGDLLYLRDEEEKKRFKEEELRDSERLQFLRMQASTSTPKEVPAPLPPKAPNPDNPPQKPKSALLASIVRVKGGKAGAAPAKRGPVEDSSSTQQKWPRIECVQAQASAQPAAVVDGKARQQQPQAAQHRDASDAEPGLAGLLGDYDSDEGDDEAEANGAKAQQPKEFAPPMQSEREGNDLGAAALHTVSPRTNKAASGTEEEAVDYE
ncbi:g8533 [Coccomyxa viridis]|uniref:G8533 protein n=1 Tax=Coccomyxa viridis TaxID=1274662 RepID=A0ABP1G0L7_9CHLO